MPDRSLTGRVQHRVLVLSGGTTSPPYSVLVLQVEETYALPDDSVQPRVQWRDARAEDLAHLPNLYNVNKER